MVLCVVRFTDSDLVDDTPLDSVVIDLCKRAINMVRWACFWQASYYCCACAHPVRQLVAVDSTATSGAAGVVDTAASVRKFAQQRGMCHMCSKCKPHP